MSEFNLSNKILKKVKKIYYDENDGGWESCYMEECILEVIELVLKQKNKERKEFIRDLKEKIPDGYKDHVEFLIDKLAGESFK